LPQLSQTIRRIGNELGIFDKAIERLAKEITKASPTATPFSEAQMRQAAGVNQQGYGNSVGLPRDPNMANVPFTPGVPLIPGAINPVRADGRPDPRRYEYQVAQNINITPTRLIPFETLRAAADQIDILRRCIEVLKAKMVGLDWDVVLAEDAVEKVMAESGEKTNVRAMQTVKEQFSDEMNRTRQFWEQPDVANGIQFGNICCGERPNGYAMLQVAPNALRSFPTAGPGCPANNAIGSAAALPHAS
jgi:hypothetical protein